MSEILKTNRTALHICIYYEFLREKNVEVAYKNFCGTVGYDVIEYVDFEYWFYRFYHGNLDFDYDRSTDPKPLVLTDLPKELLNEIVGNLDILDRFNVGKVSRKFEPIVDRFKYEFKNVSIFYSAEQRAERETKFSLQTDYVDYKKGKKDCVVRRYFDESNENHFNIKLSALSTVLTNSKSHIENFRIFDRCEAIDIMPKLIESFSQEVCPLFFANCVDLTLEHQDYIIPFLSHFKSGVLEELVLRNTPIDDDTFNKLVETDHFKQLKRFNIWMKPIPVSHFKILSHLVYFDVYINIASAEDIVTLRDILSQFVNLESAEISLEDPLNLTEIGSALGIDYDDSGEITYRYQIPNSDKLLVWYFFDSNETSVDIENN